jgi:pimeloyl-ACP methyl ester carboxylesterase
MNRLLSSFNVLMAVSLFILLGGAFLPPVTAQADDWLPVPTGPYQVGTTSYDWVDKTRDEISTDDLGDKRELIVRIWYPADVPADAAPITYFPYGDAEIPGFETSQAGGPFDDAIPAMAPTLAHTPTQSYLDASLSDAQTSYPVLLFSPGAPGMPEFATAQIQELASYGYVVAAINHPYVSGWTLFPDGRLVTSTLWEKADTDPSYVDRSVEIGAQDQAFVLDQLEMLNAVGSGDRFSEHLNLDKIGTFGISWGTWVAATTGLQDDRVRAVLVEGPHGMLPNKVVEQGFDLPIMFLDSFMEPSTSAYLQMAGPAWRVNMNGISGWSFGDFALWPGFPEQELSDVMPPRAAQTVSAYVLAFFDRYLKGEESPLLDAPSPDYPEVEIEARNM